MAQLPISLSCHGNNSPYADMIIEGRETETKHTLHFQELVRLRRKLTTAILAIAENNPQLAKQFGIVTQKEIEEKLRSQQEES